MKYTEEEEEQSPIGSLNIAESDVDICAYRINEKDMCLLVNKNGKCVYRCTLVNAFVDLELFTDPHPLLVDTFIVRDLQSAQEQIIAAMDKR